MNGPVTKHRVPYYSQWESAALVADFVTGIRAAAQDPLWQQSGADTAQEYDFWARRMCGMACLRMALDFWGHPVPPSVPLVRDFLKAGAYVLQGQEVKGLIYQPFADHVESRWGLNARSAPQLSVEQVAAEVRSGKLVMLSVHPSIRTLEPEPPGRGGHLVLAVGATSEHVLIHNPSGFPGRSQEFAPVPWQDLPRFFAGRGVVLGKH